MSNTIPHNNIAAPVVQNIPVAPVKTESAKPEPAKAEPVKQEPVTASVVEDSVSMQDIDVATNMQNATGDLLKGKVSSLLKVVADDDTDEFLDSLPTKKKRFGLFKK